MDEANSSSQENYEFLARVSWLAYLKQFFWTLLLAFGLFLAALLVTSIAGMTEEVAAITAAILALLWLLYNFWYLSSIKLYYDTHGVWLYSGVLPWAKGLSGVKWRDIDEVTYQTGFISWLFKAYTVRIGHRFTKSSEIILPNMHRGNRAVTRINELHRDYSGTIEQND